MGIQFCNDSTSQPHVLESALSNLFYQVESGLDHTFLLALPINSFIVVQNVTLRLFLCKAPVRNFKLWVLNIIFLPRKICNIFYIIFMKIYGIVRKVTKNLWVLAPSLSKIVGALAPY